MNPEDSQAAFWEAVEKIPDPEARTLDGRKLRTPNEGDFCPGCGQIIHLPPQWAPCGRPHQNNREALFR